MKKTILTAVIASVALTPAFAQEALWGTIEVDSPVINPDNTVSFNLLAPDALEVKVAGDFLPGEANLAKGENGIWTYTTPQPLAPELYNYSFIVDGVRMLDPGNVYMVRDIATLSNIFLIDGEQASLYKVSDVPHGTVSKVWYDSPTLDKKRRMTVYTPAGYEDGDETYPVMYLLHGAGGDEEAWMELGRASQILDNLIASGKAEPMIVVMTNGNAVQQAAPGESAEGLVKPTIDLSRMNRGEFEEAFPDVVNYIDNHYRTKADKQHRAIAGLSMGGFHSMQISKEFPDLFDYIGLFSAAITPRGEAKSEVYRDVEKKLRNQFDKNPSLYWIAIGEDDFLYQENVEFRKLLDEEVFPYEYMETPGGHIWRNWRIYLSEFLPRLFK